jgi:ABC-type lipoprotein release transport system permease subunit
LADLESGAYNLVFVLVDDDLSSEQAADTLTKALRAARVDARAITWRKASGMIGSTSALIKGILFVFILLLFVVAVIIIVNTLSMAALERSSEIGMMRAVGARKGFISFMFLGETAVLSFFFGGAGIVAGIVITIVLTLNNFTTDNDMVQLLFGGDTFRPLLSIPDVALVIAQLGLVTIAAVIYPIIVARGITPLDAISRE